MSWSISGSGKKAEAASRVKEQAAAITYLTGAANELKDKAAAFAIAAAESIPDDQSVSISLYGSGTPNSQEVTVSVRAQS